MAKIRINDGDVLMVVSFLKVIFGSSRDIKRLLAKVDTPDEIARYKDAIQSLVDLIANDKELSA